jgi:hypothetical protein
LYPRNHIDWFSELKGVRKEYENVIGDEKCMA